MSAVVSLNLENQNSFIEGQMYVALSGVTKPDNLFIIGKYSPNVFKVNDNAVVEYSRLPENLFNRIYIDHVDFNSLTVSLLNTQSQRDMLWISTKPKNLWKMIVRACQKVKLQMLLMEQKSLSS